MKDTHKKKCPAASKPYLEDQLQRPNGEVNVRIVRHASPRVRGRGAHHRLSGRSHV